jgi:hypothetical protein
MFPVVFAPMVHEAAVTATSKPSPAPLFWKVKLFCWFKLCWKKNWDWVSFWPVTWSGSPCKVTLCETGSTGWSSTGEVVPVKVIAPGVPEAFKVLTAQLKEPVSLGSPPLLSTVTTFWAQEFAAGRISTVRRKNGAMDTRKIFFTSGPLEGFRKAPIFYRFPSAFQNSNELFYDSFEGFTKAFS